MSSSNPTETPLARAHPGEQQSLKRLYDRVRTTLYATADLNSLGNGELQDLLALACKLYAERRQEGIQLDAFGPFQGDAGLTATDGAVTASAVLDAVSVEVFELGMWRTWGTGG